MEIEQLIEELQRANALAQESAFFDQDEEEPIGRRVKMVYEPHEDDPDEMKNRIVVPFRVDELIRIIESHSLEDNDVIEFQIPLG